MPAAKEKRPTDFITIHHPETGGEASVTRRAFETAKGPKSKGWKEGPAPDSKKGSS